MEEEEKKPTYEELNQKVVSLSQQMQVLYNKLREANMHNVFKRLDYLFEVVKLKDTFNSDFYIKCTEEIENLMSIPEAKETDKEE